jgi:hypothetical protein
MAYSIKSLKLYSLFTLLFFAFDFHVTMPQRDLTLRSANRVLSSAGVTKYFEPG